MIHDFHFIGLAKVQNWAAVTGIEYPAALLVIAPYPAPRGPLLPLLLPQDYCKRFSIYEEANNG